MAADKAGRKQAKDTRFKPGQSGNPKGCRTGSRHKATLLAQALLDGEAEELTRKVIEKAKDGDMAALRVCLERLLPPRKDGPVKVTLPKIEGASGVQQATAVILAAVAGGKLTPSEGQALAGLVEAHRKALEIGELERRIEELEGKIKK